MTTTATPDEPRREDIIKFTGGTSVHQIKDHDHLGVHGAIDPEVREFLRSISVNLAELLRLVAKEDRYRWATRHFVDMSPDSEPKSDEWYALQGLERGPVDGLQGGRVSSDGEGADAQGCHESSSRCAEAAGTADDASVGEPSGRDQTSRGRAPKEGSE